MIKDDWNNEEELMDKESIQIRKILTEVDKEEFNLSVCPECGIKFRKHYSQICCGLKCKKSRKSKQEKERAENYGKRYFADKVRKYAHKNKDKIREKARRVYKKDKDKILVRANTYHSNEKTGICFNCKKRKKTEFHHLTYKPNKFIEVCKECHYKMHGKNYYGR